MVKNIKLGFSCLTIGVRGHVDDGPVEPDRACCNEVPLNLVHKRNEVVWVEPN